MNNSLMFTVLNIFIAAMIIVSLIVVNTYMSHFVSSWVGLLSIALTDAYAGYMNPIELQINSAA